MKNIITGKTIPIYPLLLSLYPVAALLNSNLGQVRLVAGLRPALFSLAGGLLLYLALRLVLKDWSRAALISAIALLLFFSYGHIYGLLEPLTIGPFQPGRHRLLAPLWLALFAVSSWLVLRRPRISPTWSQVLNLASLALVLMASGQIIISEVRASQRISTLGSKLAAANPGTPAVQPSGDRPDVYYIILDGYTRDDGLRQDYGYDNRPFLDQLRQLGFVIPPCTQSNYAYTALSLSSSLFMDYLNNFSPLIKQGDTTRDWLVYEDYVRHNPVRQNFQAMGYKMVAFETGFEWADIIDADLYLTGNNNPLEKLKRDRDLSNFEDMFVRTTALRILTEASTSLRSNLAPTIRTVEERRYYTVRFVLDQLAQVPLIPGPKYVYVHLVAPHPPFVFDREGKYRVTQRDTEGYADEVQYLNQRVLEVVRAIIDQSDKPPVIVIQADHGWSFQNRMKILNAYYLPDGGAQKLYDTITPVNTFRLIFDTYFGGKYGFIKDNSYFSTEEAIYQFTLEPSTCSSP